MVLPQLRGPDGGGARLTQAWRELKGLIDQGDLATCPGLEPGEEEENACAGLKRGKKAQNAPAGALPPEPSAGGERIFRAFRAKHVKSLDKGPSFLYHK